MKKTPIFVIMGPTGSGKSKLAYDIAKAIGGELISADSRQIYRYANIGTNKEIFPDVKTHLIDILEPDEMYSGYKFFEDASKIIKDLTKKNIPVIVVGGTSFYIDILTGKIKLDRLDDTFHEQYESLKEELNTYTTKKLQEKLTSLNQSYFEQLNNSEKHNKHRLIRRIADITYGKQKRSHINKLKGFAFIKIGIKVFANELQENLATRTHQMITDGLEKEALNLASSYGMHIPVLSSIGYKEWFDSSSDSKSIEQKILTHTQQYVKRQYTYLKRDKDILWKLKRNDLSNKVISEVIKKRYR